MNVAIIPARGGSKRIPRKNIRCFGGQPIIAWSIQVALESNCFDRVIVSTDDEEIALVAREYGAETPFKRPSSLSDDYVTTVPVVAHAVRWISENMRSVDLACCLYPTAPFIQTEDLNKGLSMLLNSPDCDYAFSVASYGFPIQRAIRIDSVNRVSMLQPEHLNTRSQDLEAVYHDAGQFYWGTAMAWIEERPLFSTAALAVMIPRHRVQDIDTPEDWERAEWMFKAMEGKA